MAALTSPKLKELARFFQTRTGEKTVQILSGECKLLAEQLSIIAGLVELQEQELEAFRLLEANRAGRRFMEEDAAELLKLTERDGNVLRPTFGKS